MSRRLSVEIRVLGVLTLEPTVLQTCPSEPFDKLRIGSIEGPKRVQGDTSGVLISTQGKEFLMPGPDMLRVATLASFYAHCLAWRARTHDVKIPFFPCGRLVCSACEAFSELVLEAAMGPQ